MNRKLAGAVGVIVGGAALMMSTQASAQERPDARPISGNAAVQMASRSDAEPQALLSVAVRAAKVARSVTHHLAGGDVMSPVTVPDVPVDHAFDQ
ncbi:hypothetical protein GCM10017771_66870 [Streptomyces capitiformicae]|uniref:Secreted protein n=1 Tax=Streptomyces capitiformicae TaxID=2014920 RepID=A0A919DHX7_9ACTN|nr:hypothetical protein GCM10017771_66870 [Streptomyces capitiformicae]